jgi:hypothetical protein
MRVLDGRQQVMPSGMCVQLRKGDAVKFLKELMILRGENREAMSRFDPVYRLDANFGAASDFD